MPMCTIPIQKPVAASTSCSHTVKEQPVEASRILELMFAQLDETASSIEAALSAAPDRPESPTDGWYPEFHAPVALSK